MEPASSNAAPGTQVDTRGVKRNAEEEADDSERAERRSKGDADPKPSTVGPDSPMTPRPAAEKRELTEPVQDKGSPTKNHKISSVCFGISSADKIREVTAKEQEDELLMMAEGYRQAIESGECLCKSARSNPAIEI